MKIIASTSIMLILAGCSPEQLPNDAVQAYNLPHKGAGYSQKKAAIPMNCGLTYNELLDGYYGSPLNAPTLTEILAIAHELAYSDSGFLLLSGSADYQNVSPDNVQPYTLPKSLESLLSTGYSPASRALLLDMAAQISSLKEKDVPYQRVNAYLASVNDSTVLNELSDTERKALLITTSLLQSAYAHDGRRRRRDRDWRWMTGHFAATANAALESAPQAIITAFAADVYLD